jgi:putative mycofactocin binding protein MftB
MQRSPFDPLERYELDPRVSVRREPFGGLAYNYESRRLTLIAAGPLVDVVHALASHDSAREAVAACAPRASRERYERALAQLCVTGVIRAR